MKLSILHISNLLDQEGFSPSGLANLCRSQGLHIAGLLVSGITGDGSETQFKKALDVLRKLQAYVELLPSELLILPNQPDLRWSYSHFTNHLFEPLKKGPFHNQTPQILTLDIHWQILTQHTIYWTDPLGPSPGNIRETIEIGHDKLSHKDLSPSFLRCLFCYHPPDQWTVAGSVQQLNEIWQPDMFVLSGLKPARISSIEDIPIFGTTTTQIIEYCSISRQLSMLPVRRKDDVYLIGEEVNYKLTLKATGGNHEIPHKPF